MYRSYQKIDSRKSKVIYLGNVKIGGGAPISVQTMTNTITSDVDSTLAQIVRVAKVGADKLFVSLHKLFVRFDKLFVSFPNLVLRP